MGRKVARDLRRKSGGKGGVGGQALPAAPRIKSGARTPSRKRAGIKGGREGPKRSNPFMPGLRVRSDGWTAARTRVFLATLGRTGCVSDAARVAGVSTTSVNRSRALFPLFDTACGEAIARALRGLEAVAYERAVEGREMIVIRDGREVERRIMPSDSMLGLLIKRGDLKGGQNLHLTPEEAAAYVLPEAVRHRFLSREEFFSGIVFDNKVEGHPKVQRATQEETDAILFGRIAMVMRARQRPGRPCCAACGQFMPLSDAEAAALDAPAAEKARSEGRGSAAA